MKHKGTKQEGVSIDKYSNTKYQYVKHYTKPTESYRFATISFDPMSLTVVENKYNRRHRNWLK